VSIQHNDLLDIFSVRINGMNMQTAALAAQANAKSALEEVEMAWLDAQEQLETLLAS